MAMTDPTPEQLADIERRFDVAISWVQNKEIECPIRPTGRQSLYFYGRYKQAKQGDNTAPKPSMFNPIRRYMWFAHDKQKGKSSLQAKREYVAEIDRLCREFDVASLPARMHDSAHLFFSQFYNTPQHPFADVVGPTKTTIKDEEERKEQTPASPLRPALQPPSAVSSPLLSASTSASRSASPAAHRIASNVSTPGRAGGMSPPPVDGPQAWPMAQRNNLRSPSSPSEGARSGVVSQSASPAPAFSQLRTDETVAAGAGSPVTSPVERPSAATSPATAAAETRDKELLAQRLLDLQVANQTKMQQLEAQLQRSGANAAALAARFATPSRGAQPFTPVHPPSSSASASTHPHTFTSLDPSSPFATTWTSSGLKPRPRPANHDGRAVHASPDQPFPQFFTPYSQARTAAPNEAGAQRVIEAVPFPTMEAQGADGAAQRRSVASTPISSLPSSPALPAAASAAASPVTAAGVAAATAVAAPSSIIVTPAPSSPTGGLAAATAPAAASSSDSVSVPSSPSASDLSSLLSALDAEQSAQAAHFEAAERQWRARLADLDARRRWLQQQQRGGAGEADLEGGSVSGAAASAAVTVAAAIPASESVAAPSVVVDAAESALTAVSAGPSSRSPPPPPALELSVAVVPGSLLHHTLNVAKIAVPVGVGAYAAFKLYTHYARRLRLRQ